MEIRKSPKIIGIGSKIDLAQYTPVVASSENVSYVYYAENSIPEDDTSTQE